MTLPRLLLVEDDRPLVELLTWHFERRRIAVTATANGGEALRLAGEDIPDAVLLDWKLEGLCGLEVCRRLRSNSLTAGLLIVMISGRGEAGSEAAAREHGADLYVAKPFSPAALVERVHSLLPRSLA
jgi:two-component system phosphate regulon response regulator PhoB